MSRNNRNLRSVGVAVLGAAAAALIGAGVASADTDLGPFQDLFGDAGINTWTPEADALLLADDPSLDATLTTSVDNFWNSGDDPITIFIAENDPGSFDTSPGLPVTGTGDAAVALDYSIYANGLASTLDPQLSTFFFDTLPSAEGDALFLLFFPEDLLGIIAFGP
jgi:hypothetical protein